MCGQASLKSIPKQVIQGAVTEGLLEELPQSVAETIFQNLALDRPWTEGVDASVVLGTLAGGAMGAGAAGMRGAGARRAHRQQAQQESAAKAAVREAFLDQLNQRVAPVLDEQALVDAGVSLRPIKPSKQQRNSRKQEVKRLLSEQQRQQEQAPRRLEEVVYKRLG